MGYHVIHYAENPSGSPYNYTSCRRTCHAPWRGWNSKFKMESKRGTHSATRSIYGYIQNSHFQTYTDKYRDGARWQAVYGCIACQWTTLHIRVNAFFCSHNCGQDWLHCVKRRQGRIAIVTKNHWAAATDWLTLEWQYGAAEAQMVLSDWCFEWVLVCMYKYNSS